MPKHSVYLEDDLDHEIRVHAKQLGVSISEVLRHRIRTGSHASRSGIMEIKIDAIFRILDSIVGDLGYVVGATRAGSRNIQQLTSEAELYQGSFRRITDSFASIFRRTNETNGGE